MSAGLNTGNARAALTDRGDDLYETPQVAVEALLAHERIPHMVWEPACGPGSIVGVLRKRGHHVLATDLVDYSCPDSASRRDFLFEREAPPDCTCIVTNPPFKNAEPFITKARELVPLTIMLLRLAFLESERRRVLLDQGDLARVYVFRKRIPMMHRHGWEGSKVNSGMAFAWFVWDRAHRGPTELRRISWEKSAPDNYDGQDDFAKSRDEGFRVIRERMANGGPGWTPKAEAAE